MTFVFAFLSTLLAFVSAAGQLMLTEVMYLPDGDFAAEYQYIEFKNVGDAAFDFGGVAIAKGRLSPVAASSLNDVRSLARARARVQAFSTRSPHTCRCCRASSL